MERASKMSSSYLYDQ
ncbi:hypothetical protein ACVFBP_001665 [Escherichia coli]|nr:hypothetical protein [Escherichia coli]